MSSSSPSNQIRVGVSGPIEALDPRSCADYVSSLVLDQIYETPFVSLSGAPAAKPHLFEALNSEDGNRGMVYSAAIRPGKRFSDGTPLSAAIAVRSLQSSPVLSGKVRIEQRGERIFFHLDGPNPRFDLSLTQSGCSIVHASGGRLLGTGAYQFEETPHLRTLQQAARIRLQKNPFHDSTTAAAGVEFVVLRPDADGSPRSLVEALGSGEIDLTPALSASDLVTFKIPGAAPVVKPANSTAMLYMNVERRLLAEPAARRAIAATIDVLDIASSCYDRNPAAFVAGAVLPPAMSRGGRTPASSLSGGQQLIQEAGLTGATLQLLVPWAPRPYLPRPRVVAELIAARLGKAGVNVTLVEPRSSDEFFRALTEGRFDLALGGWIAETVDPADFFDAILGSWVVGHNSFANCSRWKDPATDESLRRYRSDPTDANRLSIESTIRESAPFVPLVYGQASAVHLRRVRNVTVTPTGSIPLADVRM